MSNLKHIKGDNMTKIETIEQQLINAAQNYVDYVRCLSDAKNKNAASANVAACLDVLIARSCAMVANNYKTARPKHPRGLRLQGTAAGR